MTIDDEKWALAEKRIDDLTKRFQAVIDEHPKRHEGAEPDDLATDMRACSLEVFASVIEGTGWSRLDAVLALAEKLGLKQIRPMYIKSAGEA